MNQRPQPFVVAQVNPSMDIPSIVTSGIVGFVSAGAASAISLRIGQSNFFEQRLWERRVEAYSHVIDALAKMQQYSREYQAYVETILRSEKDNYESCAGRYATAYRDAKDVLTVLALSESFVLSSAASSSLTVLMQALYKIGSNSKECIDPYDTLDNSIEEYKAVERCIKEFNSIARRDLKQSNSRRIK